MAAEAPEEIQIIGNELAVRWPGGSESYFSAEFLREHSPSAENVGEVDILGQRHGGGGPRKFPGVELSGLHRVGNYAVRLEFSDGHRTGIYSWGYLKELESK
jgi:DUF971 family protein